MIYDNEHPLAKLTPTRQHTLTAKPQLATIRVSDDGRWLFGGGFEGTLWCWDLQQLPPVPKADPKKKRPANPESPAVEATTIDGHHGWIEAMATHQNRLATGDSWGHLRLWQIDDALTPLWENAEAHDGWLRAAAFAPNGSEITTCGRDQMLRTWNAKDGSLVREWKGPHDLYTLLYHPDGRLFAGDSRGNVHQWAPNQERPTKTLDASTLYKYDRIQEVGGVKSMAYDPSSNTLAVGGAVPARGGTVQGASTLLLFDADSGELRSTHTVGETKDCYVHSIQWHPAGFWMLVTCGTPGTGQLIFVRPDDEEPFYRDTKVANPHALCYHLNSRRLCIATTNRGSNGNGRRLNKEGEYESNSTPIEIFELLGKAPLEPPLESIQ